MERMDTSLDKFYRFVYQTINQQIPEDVLGKMVVSIVQALSYLKREVCFSLDTPPFKSMGIHFSFSDNFAVQEGKEW